MKHSFIPKGSVVVFTEGTKIFEEDGSVHIVPKPYIISLDYDSPETDEYIFWFGKRCKKINVLVTRRVH
jgi:hypothetical protein